MRSFLLLRSVIESFWYPVQNIPMKKCPRLFTKQFLKNEILIFTRHTRVNFSYLLHVFRNQFDFSPPKFYTRHKSPLRCRWKNERQMKYIKWVNYHHHYHHDQSVLIVRTSLTLSLSLSLSLSSSFSFCYRSR